MTVKEMLQARREAEVELKDAISPILERFREKTGVSIRTVDCIMVDKSQYADEHPRMEVGSVYVSLAL